MTNTLAYNGMKLIMAGEIFYDSDPNDNQDEDKNTQTLIHNFHGPSDCFFNNPD